MTSLKCGTHSKHGGNVVDVEGRQIHGEREISKEHKTGGEERIKGTKSSGGAACEKMGMSEGVRMFSRIGSSLWSNAQDTGPYGGRTRLTGQWQRESQSSVRDDKIEKVAVNSAAASVCALESVYGGSRKVSSVLALLEHTQHSQNLNPKATDFDRPSAMRMGEKND